MSEKEIAGIQVDFDEDQIGDAREEREVLADVNRSGRVDGFDLARMARTFGTCLKCSIASLTRMSKTSAMSLLRNCTSNVSVL